MNGPDFGIPKVLEPRQKSNKGRLALAIMETTAVLLITAVLFQWGRATALLEREYEAMGGECLLPLLVPTYYIGKRVVLDWIATIRKKVSKA